jgi:hypothetical protein
VDGVRVVEMDGVMLTVEVGVELSLMVGEDVGVFDFVRDELPVSDDDVEGVRLPEPVLVLVADTEAVTLGERVGVGVSDDDRAGD